jgi:hypothetical protein
VLPDRTFPLLLLLRTAVFAMDLTGALRFKEARREP